jgi:hypothetical protein
MGNCQLALQEEQDPSVEAPIDIGRLFKQVRSEKSSQTLGMDHDLDSYHCTVSGSQHRLVSSCSPGTCTRSSPETPASPDVTQYTTQTDPSNSTLPVPTSYLFNKNLHDELGPIEYQYRTLEDAKIEAKRTNKPILCVEIEVPGDVDAGTDILSHPLIVEAAESLFVTVRQKARRTTRQSHLEPSRSTKVSVMDDSGVDVMEVWGEYLSLAGVSSAMVRGLEASSKNIPAYLQLLREEESGCYRQSPSGTIQRVDRHAVFGMQDSNIGEVEFGGLDGVLSTRRGHIGHQKVVQIKYDSIRLSYSNLVRYALRRDMASIIYYQSNDERIAARVEIERMDNNESQIDAFVDKTIQPDHDPKHALRQTMLRHVPLTDLQATRANRLVHLGVFNEAMHLLSPRQGRIMMQAMQGGLPRRMDFVDVPFVRAWRSLLE